MTLGSSLAMNFYVETSNLKDGVRYTAVITKEYADGSADVVVEIPDAEWGDADENGAYKYFTFDGIAAKEMTDNVTAVIVDGDGNKVSEIMTISISEYAMDIIALEEAKDTPNTELLTTVVDMLNYGAASQNHFGYGTSDLANSQLTEAQKEYASDELAVWTEITKEDEKFYGTSVSLEDTITLIMYFQNVSNAEKAMISYTDHYGEEVSFETTVTTVTGTAYKSVTVDTLAIADAETEVECVLLDANGETVAAITDSIASYVVKAKLVEGIDNKLVEVYNAINMFATSAHAYFH